MQWQDRYRKKLVSASEAVKVVKSGDRVVFASLQPRSLALELAKRKDELRDVTLLAHWEMDFPWFQPGWESSFRISCPFVTRPTSQGHKERRFDYVPSILGLSDGVHQLESYRTSIYPNADVFMLKVTPPDDDGWCRFGHAVWYSAVAAKTAKKVIAEIDSSLIRSCGERIHVSSLDYLVEAPPVRFEDETYVRPLPPADEDALAQVIGANAASLINDGDTVQIGVGTPSESIRGFLDNKNDLGLDTEVVYPWMIDLIKAGVITGKNKNRKKGKHSFTAMLRRPGDPKLAEALGYVNENPSFELHDASYVCNVPRIAANRNQVAINTVLGLDLTGQAVVTHVGPNPVSGAGGQLEFCIGSQYSKGGRSVTCMLTTAKGGAVSRIVPQFNAGSIVLIPNVYLDYLVTEYGLVNLNGKSMRERAEAIISVAHPDFHPWLKESAGKMFWP